MTSRIYTLTIDCANPVRLAEFWSAALGYSVTKGDEDEVTIASPDGSGSALLFIRVPDAKVVKNRLHLDLNPDDQEAEVRRLLAFGATRKDISQGEVGWAVLAAPEGNEFCVLTPRAQ